MSKNSQLIIRSIKTGLFLNAIILSRAVSQASENELFLHDSGQIDA